MRAIFISYRREDVEGHARSLFQDLVAEFGKDKVFMDVAGIEPGLDFRRVIDQQVASCAVLLAMIGKDWLSAKDEAGHRRLDQPADFVRLETASALKRDIPVVPILVHGAKMPQAEDLPDDLKDLAYRNAVELTHAHWDSDVRVLMDALRPHVVDPQESADPNTRSAGSVARAPAPATTISTPTQTSTPTSTPALTAAQTAAPRTGTSNSRLVAIASLLVLVVLAAGYLTYKKVSAVPTATASSATLAPAPSQAATPPVASTSPASPPSVAVPPGSVPAAPEPAANPPPRNPSAAPGRSGDPTAPAILSQGQLTVRGTWSVNLDTGAEINNAAGADFFWEQRNVVKRFLVPRNGATFFVLGERVLESVSYADLQQLTLSSQPIDGSEGRENQLRPGTVIAYKTKQGRLGKLRIIQYGYNLVIRWTTYDLK
jgi:TIR domain